MLYAKYSRSMEMLSPLSTALVKPTTAGETAKNIRHEYEIGGDVEDLIDLIKGIRAHTADPSFRIIARTYTKNGKVYHSDRPGAIMMYSYVRIGFGEVHPNGEYIIKQGDRAGHKVTGYKLVAPQLWLTVDNLFRNYRDRFDALTAEMKNAYLLDELCLPPAGFKPAVCNPDTGVLVGFEDAAAEEGVDHSDPLDGLTDTSDDSNAPF